MQEVITHKPSNNNKKPLILSAVET